MKTLGLLAAAALAVLALSGCGLSPAASSARRGSPGYADSESSGGAPILGKN